MYQLSEQEAFRAMSLFLDQFAKRAGDDVVITVLNLDPHGRREGLCKVPPELEQPVAFTAHDLLTGTPYAWRTGENFVALDPGSAHVLAVEPTPTSKSGRRTS